MRTLLFLCGIGCGRELVPRPDEHRSLGDAPTNYDVSIPECGWEASGQIIEGPHQALALAAGTTHRGLTLRSMAPGDPRIAFTLWVAPDGGVDWTRTWPNRVSSDLVALARTNDGREIYVGTLWDELVLPADADGVEQRIGGPNATAAWVALDRAGRTVRAESFDVDRPAFVLRTAVARDGSVAVQVHDQENTWLWGVPADGSEPWRVRLGTETVGMMAAGSGGSLFVLQGSNGPRVAVVDGPSGTVESLDIVGEGHLSRIVALPDGGFAVSGSGEVTALGVERTPIALDRSPRWVATFDADGTLRAARAAPDRRFWLEHALRHDGTSLLWLTTLVRATPRPEGSTWQAPSPAESIAVQRLSEDLEVVCSQDLLLGPTSNNAFADVGVYLTGLEPVHDGAWSLFGTIASGNAVLAPGTDGALEHADSGTVAFEVVFRP